MYPIPLGKRVIYLLPTTVYQIPSSPGPTIYWHLHAMITVITVISTISTISILSILSRPLLFLPS